MSLNFKDKVWGNWKCTVCKATKKACLYPKKCKCSSTALWDYDEIEIRHSSGMTGHIDMIFLLSFIPLIFHIMDFKTASRNSNKIGYATWAGKYPKLNNIYQLRSYSTALEEMFDCSVAGFSLIYLDRAKPVGGAADYVPYVEDWSKEKSAIWNKRLFKQAKVFNSLPAWLFKQTSTKTFVQSRHCHDEDSYNKWMKAAFDFSPCPFYDWCTKGKEKNLIDHFKQVKKTAQINFIPMESK